MYVKLDMHVYAFSETKLWHLTCKQVPADQHLTLNKSWLHSSLLKLVVSIKDLIQNLHTSIKKMYENLPADQCLILNMRDHVHSDMQSNVHCLILIKILPKSTDITCISTCQTSG